MRVCSLIMAFIGVTLQKRQSPDVSGCHALSSLSPWRRQVNAASAASTAHPAEVQQLQGLHEAQAHLSCVGQGVPTGGECKYITVCVSKQALVICLNFPNDSSFAYFITLFLLRRAAAVTEFHTLPFLIRPLHVRERHVDTAAFTGH